MTRVLVVDDHAGVAEAVAGVVRMSGCEAAVVNSGEAALASLRSEQFDLAVLDVSMPGMSGFDVLRWMGAEGVLPRTPVLMFSAREEFRAGALRWGAAAFIPKHDADELTAHLKKHLSCRTGPRAPNGPLS